jgi:hypothetical protein
VFGIASHRETEWMRASSLLSEQLVTGTGNDKEIKNADGRLLDDSCLDPKARNVP